MATNLQASAFLCGGLLHILLFARGEWDRYAPNVVMAYSLLCTALSAAFSLSTGHSFMQSVLETCRTSLALLAGLYVSMIVYRLLFHPLKSFPGPLAARISSFWVFWENWPRLGLYIKLRQLHDSHGDFVRIRPRELSICHPDAIADIHGPRTKIRKGEFYEQIHPAQSLQFTRDANQHRHKRRYWDKAFQAKALQEYTPRLVRHYRILVDVFARKSALGGPIDVSRLFMDLFFDVISDLTLGKSFDALTKGQRDPITGDFLARQQAVGYMLLDMWLFHLIRRLLQSSRYVPLVASRIAHRMRIHSSSESKGEDVREGLGSRKHRWYANALKQREQMNSDLPDLYTHLSQSDSFKADGIHEAQLAIIAGADTNAITVSNVCYNLCRFPEHQQKLYEELQHLPLNENVIDDQYLLDKPYLLSIINETLRLYPPVPGGLQRLTPPEGAVIAGCYIPGNMNVSTPTYALHRDPRAFVQPNEFLPSRWTSEPELVLRRDAFVPFSYGAYNCAGKPLAMMQLRMVIAMTVSQFELSFAPNREAECDRYIRDQADCFTLHIHPLPLVLTKRSKPEQAK